MGQHQTGAVGGLAINPTTAELITAISVNPAGGTDQFQTKLYGIDLGGRIDVSFAGGGEERSGAAALPIRSTR